MEIIVPNSDAWATDFKKKKLYWIPFKFLFISGHVMYDSTKQKQKQKNRWGVCIVFFKTQIAS